MSSTRAASAVAGQPVHCYRTDTVQATPRILPAGLNRDAVQKIRGSTDDTHRVRRLADMCSLSRRAGTTISDCRRWIERRRHSRAGSCCAHTECRPVTELGSGRKPRRVARRQTEGSIYLMCTRVSATVQPPVTALGFQQVLALVQPPSDPSSASVTPRRARFVRASRRGKCSVSRCRAVFRSCNAFVFKKACCWQIQPADV